MNKPYRPRRQSGVVLIIGLVFLMLMTIIGVTAIQSSTTQERMAGNASDRITVFQAAENALLDGEDAVIDGDCADLNALPTELPDPDDFDHSSWDGAEPVDSAFDSEYVLTRIPQIVRQGDESVGADATCESKFYYITAKAESDRAMAVVLRSTVEKLVID